MDVENKKTALNDEASIYHHREETTEKEKWSSLHGRKRWEYFKSYYLLKLVVAVICVAVAGSLLYTVFSPKPEDVFYAAIIDGSMTVEQAERAAAEFGQLISLDEETEKMTFDRDYYFETSGYESLQKFATYNAVGQIDITIMPLSVFEKYGPGGYFQQLSEVLPTDLYLELSPYMVECQIKDRDGVLIENSASMYGIRIEESFLYAGLQPKEPIVAAINCNDKNLERVVEFLRYLLK